jgi:hypothetical protein
VCSSSLCDSGTEEVHLLSGGGILVVGLRLHSVYIFHSRTNCMRISLSQVLTRDELKSSLNHDHSPSSYSKQTEYAHFTVPGSTAWLRLEIFEESFVIQKDWAHRDTA